MSHEDIACELLTRGADPHRANHEGGTCLINAVQSARLVSLLLTRGAQPDASDVQRLTALHYAAREHRVHTARLLLAHGADPTRRSRDGDDVLRTAALKGASAVVSLLTSSGMFSSAQTADALELLGATQMDEFSDDVSCRGSWRRATALRVSAGCPKPRRPTVAALRHVREWRSDVQLGAMDDDQLRVQALLVAERVLGTMHKDMIYRVMFRGAAYADDGRQRRAAELWLWALQLRVTRDTILHPHTWHAAAALTRLLLVWSGERAARGGHAAVALRLIVDALPAAQAALVPRPHFKKQTETFDRMLRCVTHLLHVQLVTAETEAEQSALRDVTRRLLTLQPRLLHTGDTLLHLCVSRVNVVPPVSSGLGAGAAHDVPVVFPCHRTVCLLLRHGALVSARNTARGTPLHTAGIPGNRDHQVVSLLLAAGAHMDQPNRFGDSAAQLLSHRPELVLQHTSLRCLAARALCTLSLAMLRPALRELPPTLRRFLMLHRPDADDSDLDDDQQHF